MKTKYLLLAALPLAGWLGVAKPASADTILYNDYTAEQSDYVVFFDGFKVSDSFTITNAATADQVIFTAWTSPGSSVSTMDWSIGTTPFATNTASGNGTTTTDGSPTFNSGLGLDAEQDSFNISDISLAPGTYYLTLTTASVTNGAFLSGWNQSNGPSTAELDNSGTILSEPSNSFQILGTPATVSPEPLGYIPILLGAAMLGGFIIRRKTLRQP